MLAIPTRRITGIEDPQMLEPDAPPVFADAWGAKDLVEARLGRPLPREAVGLAINSKWARSQDQLHVHVDCVAVPVVKALAEYASALDDQWRAMTVPLQGRVYFARRVDSADLRDVAPLKLLADGVEGARAQMGAYSLAAIGASFDGKPDFILLADQFSLEGGGHAEDLQDHDCAIAHSGAMIWPGLPRRAEGRPQNKKPATAAPPSIGIAQRRRVRGPGAAGERADMGKLFKHILAFAASVGGAELCLRLCRYQHRPHVSDDDRTFRLGRNLRLADLLGPGRSCDAARGFPAASPLHDGPFGQVRQCADAALDLLLWPVCDSRHDRGRQSRPAGVAWLRPLSPGNAATLFAMVQRQGAEIRIVGSPFDDVARHERRSGPALAYAPIRRTRTLNEWARDPLGR